MKDIRWFIAYFASVVIPFIFITWYHPQFDNWWVMGVMVLSFWGGMLARSPKVVEKIRTVLYIIWADVSR